MIKADYERREEYESQLSEAGKAIERLRIVKSIPSELYGKMDAQASAVDVLIALVNLIGSQIARFAILKSRTKVERGIGILSIMD